MRGQVELRRIIDEQKSQLEVLQKKYDEKSVLLSKTEEKLRAVSAIDRITEQKIWKKKLYRDTIHKDILLHPALVAIIDTKHFQRLRSLKQLGERLSSSLIVDLRTLC